MQIINGRKRLAKQLGNLVLVMLHDEYKIYTRLLFNSDKGRAGRENQYSDGESLVYLSMANRKR